MKALCQTAPHTEPVPNPDGTWNQGAPRARQETTMTDSTTAQPLPRPRTLVHPGPVGPVRIEHRHANRGRHFRLGLEPGRTLHDAIIGPLLARGVRSASMTLLGGRLSTLLYCVAPPDPTGERVANYTRP